ncbi:MAG: hypothetical protein EPO24_03910 [Bacteroidetes bacterium]|nr:MAG: hypothetical protein EPO24_03910 [Bacteroidota bacterium]
MIKLFLPLVILLASSCCLAQKTDTTQQTPPTEEKYEMRTYYMVFLYKGANRTHDSVTAAKIQEGHLANIGRLHKEGKLCIAGPFLDDTDLRGIFILTVDSLEEAKKMCDTDPAVIAGRLRYEVRPWMAARGSKLP